MWQVYPTDLSEKHGTEPDCRRRSPGGVVSPDKRVRPADSGPRAASASWLVGLRRDQARLAPTDHVEGQTQVVRGAVVPLLQPTKEQDLPSDPPRRPERLAHDSRGVADTQGRDLRNRCGLEAVVRPPRCRTGETEDEQERGAARVMHGIPATERILPERIIAKPGREMKGLPRWRREGNPAKLSERRLEDKAGEEVT